MEIWLLQLMEDDLVILTAQQIVDIFLVQAKLQVVEMAKQLKHQLLVELELHQQIQVLQEVQIGEVMWEQALLPLQLDKVLPEQVLQIVM